MVHSGIAQVHFAALAQELLRKGDLATAGLKDQAVEVGPDRAVEPVVELWDGGEKVERWIGWKGDLRGAVPLARRRGASGGCHLPLPVLLIELVTPLGARPETVPLRRAYSKWQLQKQCQKMGVVPRFGGRGRQPRGCSRTIRGLTPPARQAEALPKWGSKRPCGGACAGRQHSCG